jgi:hypothetical protein
MLYLYKLILYRINMAVPIQIIRLSVIGLALGGFITFKYVAANMAESKINGALEKAGIPLEAVSYDTSVDLFGLNVHLNDIVVSLNPTQPIKIDEIVINDYDSDHSIPQYMNIEINGFNAKEALNMSPLRNSSRGIFNKDDDISADFAIAYNYDADKKTFTIEKLSESIDGVGELSFSTVLHNIDSMQRLGMQLLRYPTSVAIGKSELKFEDDSLVEKVLAMNAKKEGMSTDKYRDKVVNDLEKELDKLNKKENVDTQKELLSTLIDFIKSPDEFEISIDPDEPMSFGKILTSNPQTLKKLNLEID